jgi:hypothetical protein
VTQASFGSSTITGFDEKTRLPAAGEPMYAAGEERQVMELPPGYDNERPHTRVMGIHLVYLAPGEVTDDCAPPPTDAVEIQAAALRGEKFRTRAPKFVVPLTGVDSKGKAVSIAPQRHPRERSALVLVGQPQRRPQVRRCPAPTGLCARCTRSGMRQTVTVR